MGRSLDALSLLEPDRRSGGGSGGRFPLELLGMSGTGRREPRGVRVGAAVGGERRGLFGLACDEAVSSLGVVPDTGAASRRPWSGSPSARPAGSR